MLQAIKIRLYPNKEQEVYINKLLGTTRFVYNNLLAYRFKEMLVYKSEWYGRDLVIIDRFFPSTKLCSNCNYKNNNLTLKDRVWVCPKCKTKHDRDYNAAINIRNEGKRIKKIRLSSPKSTLVDSPLLYAMLRLCFVLTFVVIIFLFYFFSHRTKL